MNVCIKINDAEKLEVLLFRNMPEERNVNEFIQVFSSPVFQSEEIGFYRMFAVIGFICLDYT